MTRKHLPLLDPALIGPAIADSFSKLDPRVQARNPVMFVVFIGSLLTTWLWIDALRGQGEAPAWFIGTTSLWLWFTVLFANFAEALAEGRSKAQATALRAMRQKVWAKRLREPRHGSAFYTQPAEELRKGNVVLVEAGDFVPCDGEVIEGVASVDESAVTGESAPVIRESGGDFSAVTGGTRVLSDWIVVRCTVDPGETFVDRMIAMVESAKRRKTPNEIALEIFLAALTLVFLLATVTLLPYSLYSVDAAKAGTPVTITVLIALLVCLIPTTIGALLSAIGVAGMSRMLGANVLATSGRAVEAAGDVDVLLLDKTGHDHARQPTSQRIPAGARRRGARSRRRRPARLAGGRDARGTEHRRAREAGLRHPRAADRRARRDVRAVLGEEPDERRQRRRAPDPQGGHRCDRPLRSGARRQRAARGRPPGRGRRPTWQHAARRRRWRARRSASSSSRTSSRAASRSASPSCVAWASRR